MKVTASPNGSGKLGSSGTPRAGEGPPARRTMAAIRRRIRHRAEGYLDFLRRRRRLIFVMLTVGALGALCIAIGISNLVHDELKDILLHLGADFVSAIVIFIAFEVLLERIERDKVRTYKKLPHGQIIDNMYNATRDVNIWESWTNLFTTTDLRMYTFEEAITRALRRGVKFHILLVRPGSAGMNKRQIDIDGEEKYQANLEEQNWLEENDVELNVLRNLQCFEKICGQLPQDVAARLKIRLYNSPPTIALYSWGEKACAAFFPEKELSDRIEQLEFSTETGVGKLISGQFDIAWDQGSPYEDEPKFMPVWLVVTEDPKSPVIYPFQVAFIRNDDELKYGQRKYLFCIADPRSDAVGIVTTFEAFGHLHLEVVCRGEESRQNQDTSEATLPADGDKYYIESYKHSRMDALFNAKYGVDPQRKIFRLAKDRTPVRS